MLIAAGPGVASLQDYTSPIPANTINITGQQGDTLDTFTATLKDRTNSALLIDEDDIVALNENDVNGWPTVNLLLNPSFEGVYSGGIAPNWTANTTGAGITYASSATSKYGSAAQSISLANAASGVSAGVVQGVTLPTNENGAPIVNVPYVLSFWMKVTAAFTNHSGSVVKIDWFTKQGGSFISNQFMGIDSALNSTGNYRRVATPAVKPPANAGFASCKFLVQTNSATNSGTVLVDGAQLECATFWNALVRANNWSVPLLNGNMSGTVGNAIVDSFNQDFTSAGLTFSVVNTPTLHNTAQQIDANAVAPSGTTFAIAQSNLTINPTGVYTVTMRYMVTQSLTAGFVRIGMNWGDAFSNFISTTSHGGPTAEAATGAWSTITFQIGPGTANPLPANAASFKLFAGISSSSSTCTGTVVIGEISIVSSPFNPDVLGAGAFGMYPTPYCDSTQPGCYTDTGRTGLSYRQDRVFGGYVKQLDYSYVNSVEREIAISATEYGIILQEAPATLNIAQQADVAAIQAAVTYAQQQGYLVGLDASTFVQSIDTIDAQSFAMATTRDVMNYIANQTVAAYYVDYYIRLHYTPALAVSAPFALSDQPDGITSFGYTDFVYSSDGTNDATEPVIEGGDQLSAPQAYSASGGNNVLAGLSNTVNANIGIGVSAVPVASGGTSWTAGMKIVIGASTANQEIGTVAAGATATSIPLTAATTKAHVTTDPLRQLILASGTVYTALPTQLITVALTLGAILTINTGGASTQQVTTTTAVLLNQSSIPVASFTANSNYWAGMPIASATDFIIYGGNAVAAVVSVVANGVTLTVGLASNDTLGAGGITAVYTPNTGRVQLLTALSAAQTVQVQFQFWAPVLVRVHAASAEAPTGAIRRKIFTHTKLDAIRSKQSAIDRANADNAQNARPKPIITCRMWSPPAPASTPLRAGMAVAFTHRIQGLSNVLFQVQQVTITNRGNGIIVRDLQLGFYRPDAIILLAQIARQSAKNGSNLSGDTVLLDVLTISDGWAMSDSPPHLTVNNIGTWGGATSSTWNGTFVWG